MYQIDNDGHIWTTSEDGLRRIARSNGFLDWDWPILDLIECIEECYPEVTITAL